jgi:oligopeptide transport system substrate-binding protein
LFAKAEAFLIDEAFVVPYAVGGGGYEVSKLDQFTNPFAPFGVSIYKFKGRTILDQPVSSEAYAKQEVAWQKQKNSAVAKNR